MKACNREMCEMTDNPVYDISSSASVTNAEAYAMQNKPSMYEDVF